MSRTKIKKRTINKKNQEIVETISLALNSKNEFWINVAKLLSGPLRNYSLLNLQDLEKGSNEGDTIVIPGKILSKGQLNKKLKVVALSFSENAIKKMKNSGSEAIFIKEEIKKNKKAQGLKIIK